MWVFYLYIVFVIVLFEADSVYYSFFYCHKKSQEVPIIKELQINEEIRDREVRLIAADGEQVGVVATREAQQRADESELDLVKISPNAKPPVCKIMDYGKYKYEQAKKEKEARKKQKVINVKEVRLTPVIEENDLKVKANRAIDFLKDEDKVKVSVRFRGREMGHTAAGREVLEKFIEMTSEHGVVDRKPKLEGRNMIMFLSPKSL